MNEPEVDANNFVQLLEMLHRHLNKQTNKQTNKKKQTNKEKQTNKRTETKLFIFFRQKPFVNELCW